MAKKLGLVYNRVSIIGRVVGQPTIDANWARLYLKTAVAETGPGGNWEEVEYILPVMTNDPKKMKTIQDFVQDERQLLIEGYLKSWTDTAGNLNVAIIPTVVKLGSKTMFDSDTMANNAPNGYTGYQTGGQPVNQLPNQPVGQPTVPAQPQQPVQPQQPAQPQPQNNNIPF